MGERGGKNEETRVKCEVQTRSIEKGNELEKKGKKSAKSMGRRKPYRVDRMPWGTSEMMATAMGVALVDSGSGCSDLLVEPGRVGALRGGGEEGENGWVR